jgi:hypothetical protein
MSANEKRSIFQIGATTLLAISIAYLAYGLQSIASIVPEMIIFLDKNNYQLSPAIKEVTEIRKMIPEVLAEIRDIKKLVPGVTKIVTHAGITNKKSVPLEFRIYQI